MSAYLDDELSASSRARMDRHSSECPECRRVLESLGRIVAALGRIRARGGEADPHRIVVAVRARLGEPPPL